MSGLCIKHSKTHSVWIGSKKYSNDILISNSKLNQETTKFTLLGKNFDVDSLNMPSIYCNPKLVKIKSILKQWERSHLTPVKDYSYKDINANLVESFTDVYPKPLCLLLYCEN